MRIRYGRNELSKGEQMTTTQPEASTPSRRLSLLQDIASHTQPPVTLKDFPGDSALGRDVWIMRWRESLVVVGCKGALSLSPAGRKIINAVLEQDEKSDA